MERLQWTSEVVRPEPTIEKLYVLQDAVKESERSAHKMEKHISVGSGTSFGEKKKRRKKQLDSTTASLNNEEENKEESDTERKDKQTSKESLIKKSNPDYTYEQLTGRVFEILKEKNPELAGERRKVVLQVPQVITCGSKKTVLENFMDICESMHRQPDHVMSFLLAEAGTTGSLDADNRLIIKSKFESKNFEGLIRNYMAQYVLCPGCKSKNTLLTKEDRLYFLRCQQCGSSQSVAPVSAGYVARVGRRRKDQ